MQVKDITRGRSTLTIGSTKYSNVQNNTDQNVVVLQQSNPSYELAGLISVASESPYNDMQRMAPMISLETKRLEKHMLRIFITKHRAMSCQTCLIMT